MRFPLPAALAVALLTGSVARAEEAYIYTITLPPASLYPGAVSPAKANWHCYSFLDNKCWDGAGWHVIYPLGPRHYAKPTTELVSCVAIMKASHDCWDGSNWFRLPPGTLVGTRGAAASLDVGAFITAPMR